MTAVRTVCVLLFLAGCWGPIGVSCSESHCPSDSEGDTPALAELLAAPTVIEIDNLCFRLRADLSRDFMPECPPDGQPLAGLLTVSELDSLAIPLGIRVPTAWVINGQELWQADPIRYLDPGSDHAFELLGTISGGPKWGPWIYVDVVVQIGDGDGRVYLLRAPEQWIEQTM